MDTPVPTRLMKLPRWRQNLAEYLLGVQRRNARGDLTFDWDPSNPRAMNCLQFGSGAVLAQTGRDFYYEMAAGDKYKGPASALEVLHQKGYTSLDHLMGSLFVSVPVMRTQYGDLLIIPAEDVKIGPLAGALGVCDPPYFWILSSSLGLSKGTIAAVNQTAKAYRV